MHCLGKEEAKYHLIDKSNINYYLNQETINFMTLLSAPRLKRSFARQVCRSPKPAQTFIRLVFTKRRSLFSSSILNEFESMWSQFFITVLNFYQRQSPTFDCLTRQIEDLKTIEQQIFYDSDLFTLYDILNRKNRASKIIRKLIDSSKTYYKNCSS